MSVLRRKPTSVAIPNPAAPTPATPPPPANPAPATPPPPQLPDTAHGAALRGELAKLCAALPFGSPRAAVDASDAHGRTPLHYAVAGGRGAACAAALVDRGADVHAQDAAGASPLAYAAFAGDVPLVQLLLRAQTAQATPLSPPALAAAALRGHTALLSALFPSDATTTAPATTAATESGVRWAAAGQGSADFAAELLKRGAAAAAARDGRGRTPLHAACAAGNAAVALLLLDAGADAAAADGAQRTALHHAAAGDAPAAVVARLLRAAPALAAAVDGAGRTALHIAAARGSTNALRALIEGGADVNACDARKAKPLHHASFRGHCACAALLIDAASQRSAASAKTEMGDAAGMTPLHLAATAGHSDLCALLLRKGADANARAKNGTTPLHLAAHAGDTKTLLVLLENGAKIDCALFPSIRFPFLFVLLKHKNQHTFTATDENGNTALHTAAFAGHHKIVALLVWAHSSVNAQDAQGNGPLAVAVARGNLGCVQRLLKAGANPEAPNKAGETALHIAGRVGATEAVNLIMTHLWNIQAQFFLSGSTCAFTNLHSSNQKLTFRTPPQWTPTPARPKPERARQARQDSSPRGNCQQAHRDCKSSHHQVRELFLLFLARFSLALSFHRGCDPAVKDKSGKTAAELIASAGLLSQQDVEQLNKQRVAAARARDKDSPEYQARLKEVLSRAVVLFNTKPMSGIEHMRSAGLLGPDPSDIAEFLHEHPELNKTKIGELVGGSSEMHKAVLREFIARMDFTGLEFEMALRRFLQAFRLPGEAQVIDRIMEAFAKHYHTQNPESVFADADAVYVLSFSTIMLNTDAHSANVKTKMTKLEWLRTNRKINGGEDFPQSFLETLYERIVGDEIKMEQSIFTNADKKGWLTKQGGRIKTWKRRWFILSETNLFYFRTPQDKEPCGIILLENVEVVRVKTKKNCFMLRCFNAGGPDTSAPTPVALTQTGSRQQTELVVAPTATRLKGCKMDSNGGMIEAHHDQYIFCAESKKEMAEWLSALNSAIHHNPFYALMRQKTDRAGGAASADDDAFGDDADDDDDDGNGSTKAASRRVLQSSIKLHLEKPTTAIL